MHIAREWGEMWTFSKQFRVNRSFMQNFWNRETKPSARSTVKLEDQRASANILACLVCVSHEQTTGCLNAASVRNLAQYINPIANLSIKGYSSPFYFMLYWKTAVCCAKTLTYTKYQYRGFFWKYGDHWKHWFEMYWLLNLNHYFFFLNSGKQYGSQGCTKTPHQLNTFWLCKELLIWQENKRRCDV